MVKAILYGVLGTLVSYGINHYFSGVPSSEINWYYAAAFGLGWGMAYYVDQPRWALATKMGISFIGIAILIAVGLLLFTFEIAIPSVIRFSTVFVAYYLIASFRQSKSLRS